LGYNFENQSKKVLERRSGAFNDKKKITVYIVKLSNSNLLSFQVSLTAEGQRWTALILVSHCRGKFLNGPFSYIEPAHERFCDKKGLNK
jgi:hypothetical protein